MDLLSFYRRVLPPNGVYGSSEIFYSDRVGKKICVNKGVRTLEELANKTFWLERNHAGSDVYFALAAYKEIETFSDVYQKSFFRRTNKNVRAIRSLYLDLDVKGGSFASQKAAAKSILNACVANGWPFPLMVSSGAGIHSYWPLDREIDVATFQAAQRAMLSRVTHIFKDITIDGLVDPARILRPIGTTNKKYTPPKPVYLLRDCEYINTDMFLKSFGDLSKVEEPDENEEVIAGEPNGHLSSYQIITECQQIRESGLQTEPVWRAGLSVARLCKNGRKVAHFLSAMDKKRYTPEGTDRKLDQLNHQQGVKGMPTTCRTFNMMRPNICTMCRHWPEVMRAELKSPVTLGIKPKQDIPDLSTLPVIKLANSNTPLASEAAAPAPSAAPVPLPVANVAPPEQRSDRGWYIPAIHQIADNIIVEKSPTLKYQCRTPNNTSEPALIGTVRITYKEGEDEGTPVYMSRDVMVPIACYEAKDDRGNWEQSTVWRIYSRGKQGFRDVKIANSDLHGNDAIKRIANFGVTVENAKHFGPFAECLRGLLTNARSILPIYKEYDHLGWIDNSTFSLGTTAYQRLPDNTISRIELSKNDSTAVVTEYIRKDGSLEDWINAFNVFGKAGNEYMAFAALATFGSPLMQFTNQGGLTIAVVSSESGTGKSTMQRVSMAAWGDPRGLVKHQLGPSSGITLHAFTSFLGIMHSLPAEIDELSKMPDEQVGGLLYLISSGEERQRANSSGKIRMTNGKWGNLTVVSSNKSLRDQIASSEMRESDAMIKRLIELTPPAAQRSGQDWLDASRVLDKVGRFNYGIAGEIYAQYLVANSAILEDRVQKKISEMVIRANGDQSERFWFAGAACIFVGAELAKMAGLHNYDLSHLEEWFFNVLLPEMRAGSESNSIDDGNVLGDLLTDLLRETLIVRSAEVPASESEAIGYAVRTPNYSSIYVRAEVKEKRAFISSVAIRKWADKNKMQYTSVLKSLEKAGVLVKRTTRISLGKGVKGFETIGGTRLRCIEVSIDPDRVIEMAKEKDVMENGTATPEQIRPS